MPQMLAALQKGQDLPSEMIGLTILFVNYKRAGVSFQIDSS